MKLRNALVFVVLCCSSLLFAASLRDPASWVPTGVSLGTGNDKWAFGFSRNNDDQLSYSVDLQVEAPVWFYDFHLNGYTNRGWKDAWYTNTADSDPASFYHGRYDVLDTSWGLKLDMLSRENFAVIVVPRVGFQVAGNLGFDTMQNMIHRMGHIHLVDLPYEEGTIFAPKLAVAGRGEAFGQVLGEEGTLGVAVVGDVDCNIGFACSEYLGAELFLRREDTQLFSVSYGYGWMQGYSGWKTQELADWFMQGHRFGFTMDAGAVHFQYNHSLGSTFGYTTYYVDVMDFFSKSTWTENDLYFTLANSWYLSGNYRVLEVEYPFGSSRWSIFGSSRYVAGDPSYDDSNVDQSKIERMKKGFASWSLGAKYSLPDGWSKGWVTPFMDLSIGFERWELSELKNMMPSASLPWDAVVEYTFLMDAEVGLIICPEGWLKSKESSYRFYVSGAVTWLPQADAIADLLHRSPLPTGIDMTTNSPYFIPRFTAGLQVGFDI